MSRGLFILLCALALAGGAYSQNPGDPEELRIAYNTDPTHPETYVVSWSGVAGRTYFLQCSEDLPVWTYSPIFENGGFGLTSYYFDFAGFERLFVRLIHVAYSGDDAAGADFDGDKVSNQFELANGTDPLLFADADGDLMSDDWETEFRLDPDDPGDATEDADEDGLSNLTEYQTGTAGTDPTNFYYNGFPSVFQAVSGSKQTSEPGTFSPDPLIIELKNGTTPVFDGPITVQITEGSLGQISQTNDGNGLASLLNLRTNSEGQVAVYFKNPTVVPGGELTSYIQAQIGSAGRHGVRIVFDAREITQVNYTYPTGTVGGNATDAIDDRIAATNQALDFKSVFSTQFHGTPLNPIPNYIRNTSSWCYDLRQQMTCISPWNSEGANLGAGTAITARHVIGAYHNRLSVSTATPTSIRFITANAGAGNAESVITRTIIGRADHPDNDVCVYTLSASLPGTITPCKILPANYEAYLSYLGGGRPPVMYLDQEEKALVAELHLLSGIAEYAEPLFHTNRMPFYEEIIGGDSGNPAFLIIKPPQVNDAALVLLSAFTYGRSTSDPFAGSGHFVTNLDPTLNAMIVAADADAMARNLLTVSTGLQVQTVDLSGFDEFVAP